MTSSLVGSEMCIRDRPRPGGHPSPPRTCSHDREPASSPTAAEHTTTRPVSYTHLTLPTICSV
eukprot:5002807-Prorocentrum_lima.AAC.1